MQRRSINQIASFAALGPEPRAVPPIGRGAVDRLLARSVYAINNELVAWWMENSEVPREEVVGLAHDLLRSAIAAFQNQGRSPSN